jgi:ribosomal protein S12 methylthiotransferase accessory factor
MTQYPQFKAHFHVEAVPGEGVFLLSEKSRAVLRGRLYELVAPTIDGRRSTDDIVDQLSGRLSPAEVYHVLGRLEKKGYLAEGNHVPPEEKAFWHIQDIDPAAAMKCLAETTVSITSLGGLAVGPLRTALQAVHVRVVAEGQCHVVLTDDYLREGLKACNEEALGSGRPWLLVKPVGSQLWIGPLLVPRKTGCWECLAQRLRANREAEVYVHEKQGRPDPFPVPFADTPATRAVAWNLAATEILKWVASGGCQPPGTSSNLEGKIRTFDLLTWKTQTHTLVRRPQCRACGDPQPQVEPALVLQSRKKSFTRDGGHRVVSPEETLRRYEHHVSPLTGAVTLLERVRTPSEGIVNVYGAGHNFARRQNSLEEIRQGLRTQSSGKGTSDVQARASGLCEALERYSGVFRGDEPRTTPCRMRDLGDAAIHPNACMHYSDHQYRQRDAINARKSPWNRVPVPFDEDQAIEWTPVWSFTRREVRYLPTAFCYYDYPQQPFYCFGCSNGNAAGNTLEEAILQGFFELVERDSVALWWYNRVRRPAVDLDSFDEPYVRQLAAYLRDDQQRELWVLDLTSDLDIPVFVALSRRTDRQPEEILTGFGAHFDARIALLRAVTELNQMLTFVLTDREGKLLVQNALEDLETLYWLKTATLQKQPYLAPAAEPLRARAAFSNYGTDDLRDDVLACQVLVERQGLEMLVLDQTRPDIGLPVVKVIVPGLRHFWARFAPGRLYDGPVKLGWLPQPLREEELNPISMFL